MRVKLNTRSGGDDQCAQAVLQGERGAILANDTLGQPRPRVASADREHGGGGPFRSGRFVGRNRKGHCRLDGNVTLTGWHAPMHKEIRMVTVYTGLN